MIFKEQIEKEIKKEVKADISLEIPPDSSLGDYALPCFKLCKAYKKSPNEIAEELSKKIKPSKIIDKVIVNGPYLNFFINKEIIIKETLSKIIKEKDKFGSEKIKSKKILIEHTSINPNASPHVGRARNAIIGDSLARLFRFHGYNAETHYFVNDVGKQIAILVLGCEKRKKVSFDDLLDIYIGISKKVDKNPKFEKDVFDMLHELEKGNKKTVKKFKDIVKICIEGQKKIFSEFGIRYDYFDFESDYLWSKETEKIIDELKKTGKLFEDEQGRYVLDQKEFNLAMKSPVLVLTRADKTSLYPLRDMAYTIEKAKKDYDRNIIVLGEDQKLYFQQLSAALSIINHKAPEVIHYSFVLLSEGKMSTRQGNLVLLEEFMDEAVKKAEKEIMKRNKKISKNELEKLAKAIGHSAIKYTIIRVSPEKNVTFDWKHALSFEGDTGPYLQYSHARICSILNKYGKKVSEKADYSLLKSKEEMALIKQLSEFPDIASQAASLLKPHLIANYLYSLAQNLNEFYHACPILKEKDEIKKARLLLVSCVKQTLANGLNILGIEPLERM